MAFAIRSLRILCKVHNVTGSTYSTLRHTPARVTSLQTVKKYFYSTEASNRPKIAGSLTNIQSSTGAGQSFGQDILNNEKLIEEKPQQQEEEDRKAREHAKKMMNYSFIFFGTVMGIGLTYVIYELAKPTYDEHGNIVEDEYSSLPFYQQIWYRFRRELKYYTKLVQEPSREKLLPDPLKYPYIQPPYTLVLELTDVLVHPDWTYQTGWRFKKRPGVDQFLENLAPPQFEVVVYTAEQGLTVFPILDALDPNGYIMYRLVRDATRFVDGHHVKDLDALNRDLNKVIVIDWNGESVKFHPENTLKIPRWTGNDDDTTLYDLAAFLKTILTSNVEDVRTVLNYYRQFDNPLKAFRENQQKLLLQMEEEEKMLQKEKSKILTSRWQPSFLRNR
ncbi:mitochondrial import inner membrane translocase subunit TIM50-C-like [Prorops nasuta]|uniref:mitochondrial import inner membrane translocase subunit TIM50-C-like n=1 Tax=Prorops nasuta TaxID=863751 RepID=UPI0034CD906E